MGPSGLTVAALAGLLVACSSPTQPPAPQVKSRPSSGVGDARNIVRADYIGPRACGECHAEQFAQWTTSLHRVMNVDASERDAVIGDFGGVELAYAGGIARFERDLAGYVMTTRKGPREVRYRITRTIGRRGLQEYVGIEAGTREPQEVRLPFGWWPRAGGWFAQPYFDPWLDEAKFDPYAPVREPWAERCPWCHSTYPFEQRIARSSRPRGLGHGLEQLYSLSPGSERLAVADQVTTGISCESCHLGGRAHAAGAPIQFLPHGAAVNAEAAALPATFNEQRRDARVVNGICAQCHSGPSPRLSDGTGLRNSSEALDLGASSCTGIKCTDCHDPHRADARGDETRALATCVGCHELLADPGAARAHAGAGHATTNCLDCHMPRIVQGIDRYVRTHRISSPTNPALIAEAAPNACNLCHLDRSIDWTLTELRAGWDVRITPKRAAYGSDDASVGDVWLTSKLPAIRLIAAHAYARSPLGKFALTQIEAGLRDPLAYVRMWTQFAVEDLKAAR